MTLYPSSYEAELINGELAGTFSQGDLNFR